MLKRIYDNLGNLLKKNKVLVIYGPRRVGKTTLLNNFLKKTKFKYKLDSGDNIKTQEIISSQDFDKILSYVENYELLAIDEAQRIPAVGLGLKIIVDQRENIYIVVTGSSSFDLSQQVGEPLTGRKRTIILYPLSQKELYFQYNKYELKEKLEEFLIFGSYPEIIISKNKEEKIEILNELVNSYLLKDILSLEKVKSPKVLLDLLKLLAFQVGKEVSLNELSNSLKIDVKTVGRYLDLLEKSFVIKRINGFSRNLRREVTKKAKYYFIDNGVRNGVISQFNDLSLRNDQEELWENFMVSERMKKLAYSKIYRNLYFWRTYDGQEVDLVEEGEGKLFGYEFKWSDRKKSKKPKDWDSYENSEFRVINRENYLDFVL